MPQPEGIGEPLDEDNFDAVGLPPWEAQKLRNKEERKEIAKVMQDRMQEAIAAAENIEAPPAAAQPEEIDEWTHFKTTICRNWAAGYCRDGAGCTFAHGEEDRPTTP